MRLIKKIKEWIESIRFYEEIVGELRLQQNVNIELIGQISDLQGKLKIKNQLKEYWDNKRIKIVPIWKARNGVEMDLRCFFQTDGFLPFFEGKPDEIADQALRHVIENIDYVSDWENVGKGEHWYFAFETNEDLEGDCDDGAILIANILLNSGIPHWRIRLNKGHVKQANGSLEYHAWCTYLAEDNKWRVLDWCFHPEKCVNLGLKWKEAKNYLRADCSWNSEFGFGSLPK